MALSLGKVGGDGYPCMKPLPGWTATPLSESDVLLRRDVKDGQTMIGTCRVASSFIQRKTKQKTQDLDLSAQAFCLAGWGLVG